MKKLDYDSVALLTVTSDKDDELQYELKLEEHKVSISLTVRGKSYYYPEKRVPGNPTFIEQEEESGVSVTDCILDELVIDGVQQSEDVIKEYQEKYKSALIGIAEYYNDKYEIEWESTHQEY